MSEITIAFMLQKYHAVNQLTDNINQLIIN